MLFLSIYFVGVRGSTELGNIAIDDIEFVDSSCNLKPSSVIDELDALTTTLAASTTPQMPASDEFTCNFDDDNKCGWLDDLSLPVRWTLTKGSQSTGQPGPLTDVSKSGYYAYVDGSSAPLGSKARIISPLIDDSQNENYRKIFRFFRANLSFLLN